MLRPRTHWREPCGATGRTDHMRRDAAGLSLARTPSRKPNLKRKTVRSSGSRNDRARINSDLPPTLLESPKRVVRAHKTGSQEKRPEKQVRARHITEVTHREQQHEGGAQCLT